MDFHFNNLHFAFYFIFFFLLCFSRKEKQGRREEQREKGRRELGRIIPHIYFFCGIGGNAIMAESVVKCSKIAAVKTAELTELMNQALEDHWNSRKRYVAHPTFCFQKNSTCLEISTVLS